MSGENSIKGVGGLKVMINRYAKGTPDYNEPTDFVVGIGQSTPLVTDTDLSQRVPISNGTLNDDGSNQLTGSGGGDNSTDNTTTFKEGAGGSDATAQNLIANGTSATKTWSISNLATAGVVCAADEYTSLWLYFLDATTLAKLLSSGTCLEVKLGSDSSNYYSKEFVAADLSTGWNLINLGVLNTNSETGSVGTPIDYFEIVITTNNSSDSFVAGDIVYDLLRQWTLSDTVKALSSVTVDEDVFEVTLEGSLTTTEANGYQLDGHLIQNDDASPIATDISKHDGSSKSSTDIFTYTIKNRLRGIE